MKTILFFLSLQLLVLQLIRAQTYAPGIEAQGYLDYKNSMVDYATGTFSYNVPLFTLATGSYLLPVSLNYTGTGVQLNARPGVVALNWNLLCGGVVTRTVRGIFDDLKQSSQTVPFESYTPGTTPPVSVFRDIRSVNEGMRDGEYDIFTAIFNGQSVKFFLIPDGVEWQIHFLEKTNVRVTYTRDGGIISGWDIVDEDGVRYVYRMPEWSRVKSNLFSFIKFEPKSYISSWYLSRIEVPNAEPICFEYQTPYPQPVGDQPNERVVTTSTTYQVNYEYGSRITERVFNPDAYQSALYKEFGDARLGGMSIQAQTELQYSLAGFKNETMALVNIDPDFGKPSGNETSKVMGMEWELEEVAKSSANMIASLDRTITSYGNSPAVKESLGKAKEIFIRCLNEQKEVTEKTQLNYEIISYDPARIASVSTGSQQLTFVYGEWSKQLTAMILSDYRKKQLQEVFLHTLPGGLLEQISWYGDHTSVNSFQQQTFRYYHAENAGVKYFKLPGSDKWGYRNGTNEEDHQRSVHPDYVKSYSLASISTTDGGSIEIDYEPNRISTSSSVPGNDYYAGIRVKTLVMKAGSRNNTADTIRYHYPGGGYEIPDSYFDRDTVRYLNISDIVTKLPVKARWKSLIEANNGILYPYVEEELVGKGRKSYCFFVPSQSQSNSAWAYWLYGLPLAGASYDQQGRLVELRKNKYMTDLYVPELRDNIDASYVSQWFEACPPDFEYDRNTTQIKAWPYYVDKDSLSRYYQPSRWGDNYALVKDIYEKNLLPRFTQELPVQHYTFGHGGKTVLKKQTVYGVTGAVPGVPSRPDLDGSLPEGCYIRSERSFFYPNSANTINPLYAIEVQSNGDEVVTVMRTPLDFAAGSQPFIDRMRACNVVSPVVKEQRLLRKKGETNYYLQDEQITTYREMSSAQAACPCFVPERTQLLKMDGEWLAGPSIPPVDAAVMSCPPAQYRDGRSIAYREYNHQFLPEAETSPGHTAVTLYDQGRNNPILQANNTDPLRICAVDRLRVEPSDGSSIPEPLKGFYGLTLPGELTVTPGADDTRFRVTFLVKPTTTEISVAGTLYGNTTRPASFRIQGLVAGRWQLASYELDLGEKGSTRSVVVAFPIGGQVAYGVITPADLPYDAMSYDAAGRLFCRFNQNLLMERYEYDDAGRMLRRFNGKNDLLQEFQYNL